MKLWGIIIFLDWEGRMRKIAIVLWEFCAVIGRWASYTQMFPHNSTTLLHYGDQQFNTKDENSWGWFF